MFPCVSTVYNIVHLVYALKIFSVPANSSGIDVIQQFYSELVRVLPLGDATFRSDLFSAGLLSINLKKELKSLETDAEKAEYFLDCVIKNDITSFQQLASVMEGSADEIVRKLARRIKDRIEPQEDKPGT